MIGSSFIPPAQIPAIMVRGESLLSPRFVFPQRGGWDMAEVFRTPKVSGAVADPLWKAHYILQL